VFATGIRYMIKLIGKGPATAHAGGHTPPSQAEIGRPARPLSAASDDTDPALD